jgi:NitT/TauT family transport system ATP-binding protein
MKNVIEYKEVHKYYKVRKGKEVIHALDGITFNVNDKEFICVVGPSGCGKTTLLKITCGLLSYDNGEVVVNGKNIKGPISNIGMVFQAPVLLAWRNIIGNIMLPVEILGLDNKKYQQNAMDLIKLVGLEGFDRRYPSELSGGMQQRVSICRALIHNPDLLLMDEPFGSLDAITRDKMNIELLRIWAETQKTILYITHNVPEAVFLADRVVVLSCRPAKVAEIVRINLPRPRTVDMQYTPQFRDHCQHVTQVIQGTLETSDASCKDATELPASYGRK